MTVRDHMGRRLDAWDFESIRTAVESLIVATLPRGEAWDDVEVAVPPPSKKVLAEFKAQWGENFPYPTQKLERHILISYQVVDPDGHPFTGFLGTNPKMLTFVYSDAVDDRSPGYREFAKHSWEAHLFQQGYYHTVLGENDVRL